MSAFQDMFQQAKASAVHAAKFVEQGSAKFNNLKSNSAPPTFEDAIEKAVQGLIAAQGALGQAMSLAPSDSSRTARRAALGNIHESLQLQLEALDKVRAGGAVKHVPSQPVPKSPAPPPAAPVIDLLGPGQGVSPTGGFADFAAAPAACGGDFADFASAPAPAAKSEGDLLDGFASFGSTPPKPSGGASSDSLFDLLDSPPSHRASSASLDDLINGMSAADELNMAMPLMPDAMGGGPQEPAKRLKLPGAMQANAPPEPEESQSQLEKRVQQWSEGKNLQAMLASLHEIAPKCCRWEPRTLGALLDESALKDAYKLSLIAVHPDKLDKDRPEWERARCQLIFNCLRRNRPRSNA